MSDPAFPKNEKVWLTHRGAKGELKYLITSNTDSRDWYFLYVPKDGRLQKLGKARTPPELIEKYRCAEKRNSP